MMLPQFGQIFSMIVGVRGFLVFFLVLLYIMIA